MAKALPKDSMIDTKEKILLCARKLFSRFGFDGTSVRQIAKECECNIASINYHFQSKESLYWNVIDSSYSRAESISKELFGKSKNITELSLGLFDAFRQEQEMIRNTMKLLLSDQMSSNEDSIVFKKSAFGPPGGEYFAQLIAKEVPYELSPMGTLWGVKSIFGAIFHWSTMCTTVTFPRMGELNPLLKPEQIRKDLEQIVQATIAHLRAHPDVFGK